MTMLRPLRGDRSTVVLAVRVWALLVLLATATGCGRVIEPSVPATAAPSVEPATASPTVVVPTDTPVSPTEASLPPAAGLVLHLTTASDLGAHGPGTTILDDRRIIWGDNRSRPIESRLGRKAFADILAAIEAVDALDRDGRFFPELRPGKQPPGHGLEFHVYDLVRDGKTIRVSAADPASFQDKEDIWVIPPEMHELTDLAHRLVDPLAWLGPDAFTEPVRPYQATAFLVEIHLYPTGGGGSIPDVDDVRWPFGEPIERVGVPYEAGGDPEARCLFIDAATASLTVAAEENAGVQRELTDWSSPIDYEWPRVGGFVTVTFTHVLPFESGTCVELATTFR